MERENKRWSKSTALDLMGSDIIEDTLKQWSWKKIRRERGLETKGQKKHRKPQKQFEV